MRNALVLLGQAFVLMLLTSGTGCGAAPVLVHNADGKLDAKLPAGWQQIPIPEYHDAQIIAINPAHTSCVSVYVAPYLWPGLYFGGHINRSITLDKYVQECMDYSEKHAILKDRVVHGPQKITLNEKPAVRFRTTGRYQNRDCEYFSTMFASGEKCVLVRCWCAAKDFDRNQSDFESITASVVRRE